MEIKYLGKIERFENGEELSQAYFLCSDMEGSDIERPFEFDYNKFVEKVSKYGNLPKVIVKDFPFQMKSHQSDKGSFIESKNSFSGDEKKKFFKDLSKKFLSNY